MRGAAVTWARPDPARKGVEMRSLRRLVAAAVVMVVMVVAIPAKAAPPETFTRRDRVTETYIGFFPGICEFGGPLYEITLTYTVGEHVTEFDDGRFHGVYTSSGRFVAEPLDEELAGASGRFTIWNGFNQNNQKVNGGSTFTVVGRFDDGTKISTHVVEHLNTTPTGAEFWFRRCRD